MIHERCYWRNPADTRQCETQAEVRVTVVDMSSEPPATVETGSWCWHHLEEEQEQNPDLMFVITPFDVIGEAWWPLVVDELLDAPPDDADAAHSAVAEDH